MFHYALKPSGFLMLGTSETIGSHADLFRLVDKKNKLYTKKAVAAHMHYDLAMGPNSPAEMETEKALRPEIRPTTDVPQQADRLVLAKYGPPGVIINRNLEILHFRGHTGPYIDPVPGAASLNLVKVARQDLLMDLRSVVHNAISKGVSARKEDVRFRFDGGERRIHIQVDPIKDPLTADNYFLVLFEEQALVPSPTPQDRKRKPTRAAPAKTESRMEELERELMTTREYMQSIVEEQEATNEELKSANEETQSTNEELQSTNEELETAKEELQSTNEELATVNEELENRNQELTDSNNDLTNLLSSVNLPILMLDEDLRVRQFTPQAKRLLNLIATDVGRPINDIRPNLELPELGKLALEVIDTMSIQTQDLADSEGRFFEMTARPYRTLDNRIAGAVITFVDVSRRESMNRQSLERLAAVVRDSNDAITVQDLEGNIQAWNPRAQKIYGYSEQEALARNIRDIVPKNQHKKLSDITQRICRGEVVMPFETVRFRKDGKKMRIWLNLSLLLDQQGKPRAVVSTERLLDA